MTLSLDGNNATYQIRAYQPGSIKINDTLYHQSLIVTPNQCITDWPPQSIDAMTREQFNLILTLQPTLILLGTGHSLIFPSLEITRDAIERGIGLEIMDTHAACRTYQALTAEDRNVVAALIIR